MRKIEALKDKLKDEKRKANNFKMVMLAIFIIFGLSFLIFDLTLPTNHATKNYDKSKEVI